MSMLAHYEVWFVTGSQHLYGPETLEQVAADAKAIASGLDPAMPVKVVWKPTVTVPDEITRICQEANVAPNCIGLICWMHTFSPAKMWIGGLKALQKPFVHLHTQYNRDIPWSSIDMDFMNLNQSAHGGREFGFIASRMRRQRTVVVGHWQEQRVQERLDTWLRAAAGWHHSQSLKVARFGDNMREVAVTEGDKVAAQLRFGYSVNGYGVGDLVAVIDQVAEADIDTLCAEYADSYTVQAELLPGGARHGALRDQARIELGIEAFLVDGGFGAFTDTFEDLHGLPQLPGLATQRLMAKGYGFGAEGDWKTAALLRCMKVMADGLAGGTSFMEDYTYHLEAGSAAVLGAHMLEVCPSIAAAKPSLEIHTLGIGGKEDPARLVFTTPTGPAINASVIDVGNRFRLVLNAVDCIDTPQDLPKLPVARAYWTPQPDLATAAGAWIQSGAAHHSAFSMALGIQHLDDFANIAGIESLVIDNETKLRGFMNEIRWNDCAWSLGASY